MNFKFVFLLFNLLFMNTIAEECEKDTPEQIQAKTKSFIHLTITLTITTFLCIGCGCQIIEIEKKRVRETEEYLLKQELIQIKQGHEIELLNLNKKKKELEKLKEINILKESMSSLPLYEETVCNSDLPPI